MPAYLIVESSVKDGESYRQYVSKVPETLARFGGRYLARGNRVITLSGSWKPERVVLIEFPDEQQIREWLSSPEYRAIAPLREAGADTRAIIVEGSVD
jgi:uncharacterized protein (DUF1330 family)